MMKAYHRLKELIKGVDVVIEIRDGRAPLSSGNEGLETLCQNKKLLLLLNKEDLAEPLYTEKWINYFNRLGRKTFAVNSRAKTGIKPVLSFLQTILEQRKIDIASKGRKDARVRVIVVGIPNAGKSAFINAISKRGQVKVGKKAGLTRGEQWIKVSEGLELLDTPGILPFSKKETSYWKLAITCSVNREKLEPLHILEQFYNAFHSDPLWYGAADLYSFLKKKGVDYSFFIKGGEIDLEKTARKFLQDLGEGKVKERLTLEFPEDITHVMTQ
jgi:ribosome biogenesis GTPase A